MREYIIIILIILVILIGGVCIQKHINKTSDDLISKVIELKREIANSKYTTNIDKSKLTNMSDEVDKKWDEIIKTWSVIIMHEELDKIHLSIKEIKACMEVEDLDTGLEETEKTLFLLSHIKEKESLKLINIF